MVYGGIRVTGSLYDYLEKTWDESVLFHFSALLEEKLNLISTFPEMYKASERLKGTRECVVTKHNTLFYLFDGQLLNIVAFWSNFQNPEKLT